MARAVLSLDQQCKAAGLPEPIREYRFCATRKFRFDYAWEFLKLAAEVDGSIWTGGRHSRGAGIESDCEKVNLAVELGWQVCRFTTSMVADGRALNTLQRLLK